MVSSLAGHASLSISSGLEGHAMLPASKSCSLVSVYVPFTSSGPTKDDAPLGTGKQRRASWTVAWHARELVI